MLKFSVPGNLLLFGEYAVVYPGGLGIAIATEEKLIVEITPSKKFSISGIFAGKDYCWNAGDPFPNPLLQHIVTTLNRTPKAHIHLDSSQFYYEDGTKKGYGSSAAATIGLTYALMHEELESISELATTALELHRSLQGGRGSGYDILTSCMGGAGLFCGGECPTWTPLDTTLYQNISLVRGPNPCDSKNAVEKLTVFASKVPARFEKYMRTSNTLVAKLTHSLHSFPYSVSLNRWINRQLDLSLPWKKNDIKPLGAGGELGALLYPIPNSFPLNISTCGVQWNP
jgi:phosphomevalonate kinase